MKIRAFRPSDLEALHAIDQACFAPGISYSCQELIRFIRRRSASTWVAEAGGKVAGFLVADKQPKGVAHIVTVDVIEPERHAGIGSALMDAAEGWGLKEGCRMVYLETAEDNLVAQKFYTTRGYTKVDEIEHYYTDGKAAWIMVKWLTCEM